MLPPLRVSEEDKSNHYISWSSTT